MATVRDGVARLELCRSARLDDDLAATLIDLCEEIELDERVAVVLIASRGKLFCGPEADGVHRDAIAAVAKLSAPVIAVVAGAAVAEGCELALACDLRIAAPSASFRLPQVGDGRMPHRGATQRLPRLIGRGHALDLLLSGRVVRAREAERLGLVTRIAAAGRLTTTAAALGTALADKGHEALRFAKEAMIRGLDLPLDQGIRLEQDLYVLLQTTDERRRRIAAFHQRPRTS